MPTGYTAKLMEEGQTFPEFAMLCARAFGALVELRDNDMDAPIPENLPLSDYHVKALASANQELARLDAMTPQEREAFGVAKKAESLKSAQIGLEKENRENERIDKMVSEVSAWVPPSRDHEGMKSFMLEQLTISRNGGYYANRIEELNVKTPISFWDDARTSAKWSVEYHAKHQREEIDRNTSRNNWLKQLRASLGLVRS